MNKRLIFLLIVLMLLNGFALALTGTTYPAYDGVSPVEEAFGARIGSDSLLLPYDSDAARSFVSGGYIQACFFAYDAAEENYVEIYLMIPETVKGGDVLTSPGSVTDQTCVGLYEVFANGGETEHLAGQMVGITYPAGSSYEIRIDDAQTENGAVKISGTINAVLVATGADIDRTIELKDGKFSFTIATDQTPSTENDPFAEYGIPLPEPKADDKKYVKV